MVYGCHVPVVVHCRMHYVYVLLSQKDDKFYIGFTSDLERRLKEHNDGKAQSTKSRRPLKLLYYELRYL